MLGLRITAEDRKGAKLLGTIGVAHALLLCGAFLAFQHPAPSPRTHSALKVRLASLPRSGGPRTAVARAPSVTPPAPTPARPPPTPSPPKPVTRPRAVPDVRRPALPVPDRRPAPRASPSPRLPRWQPVTPTRTPAAEDEPTESSDAAATDTAAAATDDDAAADGDTENGYGDQVQAQLYQQWHQPSRSEVGNEQPTGRIRLTIDRNGKVLKGELIVSSGHAAMDRSIERLLADLKTLPPLPATVIVAPLQLDVILELSD